MRATRTVKTISKTQLLRMLRRAKAQTTKFQAQIDETTRALTSLKTRKETRGRPSWTSRLERQ